MTKTLRIITTLFLLTTFAATTDPATQPSLDERAKIVMAKTDIQNISTALDAFEIDTGRYPTTAEGLAALSDAPKDSTGWRGPYLKNKIGNDPWNHPYLYTCPGQKNKSGFDLSSSGPDGTPNTPDDITN